MLSSLDTRLQLSFLHDALLIPSLIDSANSQKVVAPSSEGDLFLSLHLVGTDI